MKILGIVGGIAPESTIDYYRSIIASYRERTGEGSYPRLIINSIDLQHMLSLIDRLDELAAYIADAVSALARANASFAVIASNTPHIAFDAIRERSPIPLISIVEAARDHAAALRMKRPLLIGTRFTMRGGFYQAVFSVAGMNVVVPDENEQDYIHETYFGELVAGRFLPETRHRFLSIIRRAVDASHADSVILGGTELPLLLRGVDAPVPLLDTTHIHVDAAVAALLQR